MIVYMYIFPNGKRYIGQTSQTLEQRAQKGYGYRFQPLVYNAIQKYGWDNIQKEIFECNSLEEMDTLEVKLIAKYKTTKRDFGYNLDSGGHANKRHSQETKQKISNSIKGDKHPFFGTHRSETTRKKLSEYHTGLLASEETKQKMSESHKGHQGYWEGKSFSEEHKRHISASVSGKKNGMYGKNHSEAAKKKISKANSTEVICLKTKEVYPSIKAAGESVGLTASAISLVINGKNKTAGKLHWMRLAEYLEQYGEI